MEFVFKLVVPPIVWIITIAIAVVLIFVIFLLFIPEVMFSIRVSENYIYAGAPLAPSIKVSKGDIAHVEVVNLEVRKDLSPTIRLYGIGLPGFRVGWYKLSNGSKAYLAINEWRGKAVIIDLRDGRLVILAPKDIDRFVSTLRQLGWIK